MTVDSHRKQNFLPVVSPGERIPKIIHQTFYSKDLPPEIQANVAKIKAMNPGWEYKLYDDADIAAFLAQHYNTAIAARFHKIDSRYGAAKADLFRYLLLYKVGGVYLDIKSTLNRPLDEVLRADDRFILSSWNNGKDEAFEGWGLHAEVRHIPGGEFQQWHIIAAPRHPFLKAVIERVLTNIGKYNPGLHGTGRPGVLRLTGPVAYTLAIAPLLSTYPHRMVDSAKDLGLQYSIYDQLAHKTIFKSHYTKLDESIVHIGPGKKLLATMFNGLRKIRNLLVPGH
jgi:hypothetical protein